MKRMHENNKIKLGVHKTIKERDVNSKFNTQVISKSLEYLINDDSDINLQIKKTKRNLIFYPLIWSLFEAIMFITMYSKANIDFSDKKVLLMLLIVWTFPLVGLEIALLIKLLIYQINIKKQDKKRLIK